MANDFLLVRVLNERKTLRDIDDVPEVVRQLLEEKMHEWVEELRELVVENIESRLYRKSGRLENSPRTSVTKEGLRVEGQVYIRGIPYAAAQEYGAVIPPHRIDPRNTKVLAFLAASGNKVFAASVMHPGGTIPPSHFMRDAYRTMSPRITQRLRYLISERLRNKMGKS